MWYLLGNFKLNHGSFRGLSCTVRAVARLRPADTNSVPVHLYSFFEVDSRRY